MLAILMLLLGQTVDCSTLGNTTHCTTQPGVPAPDYSQLGPNVQRAANSVFNAQRPASAPVPNDTSAEAANARRSTAYVQVGELIAKGDCDGAIRLANFYGHDDIIGDTKKACQR